MPVLTTSIASDAVDAAVQKYFLKDKQVKEEYFRKFYNVTTGVTDLTLRDSGLSGLGLASRVVENAVIVSEVPVQTFDQSYVQVLYSKLMGFTWMMWKYGIKKRDVTRVVNALKTACYAKRETLLAEKFDAAYLTSYTHSDDGGNYVITTTGGDGLAMASASHTREDGGTVWSNVNSDGTTVNMVLDYPGLKALFRVASNMVNPKGQPFPVTPNRIMVRPGTAAAFRAKEILGALKNNKIPGEFSNDGAAIQTFEVVENRYLLGTGDATSITNLTAATNWHAIDSTQMSDEYGPQYFESQGIQLDEQNLVYKTKELQYTATLAFAYGHNDARIVFSSQGDNT